MLSAALRKSVTDLSRRRARTVFSVATLALAVASISFFAVPTLIDRAMQERGTCRTTRGRDGGDAAGEAHQRAACRARGPSERRAPSRRARRVEMRVLVGARRAPARVIGVRDFARQQVDVVRVESGSVSRPAASSSPTCRTRTSASTTAAPGTPSDRRRRGRRAARGFVVSGRGRSLPGGEQVQDENVIVLYAPAATVEALSGRARATARWRCGCDDPSPRRPRATVAARCATTSAPCPGFAGFWDLPDVRAPGDWPGKAETEKFAELLERDHDAGAALRGGLDLEHDDHARRRADARDRDHARRSAPAAARWRSSTSGRHCCSGRSGALVGIALGIVLSGLLARYFGSKFWAVDVGFGVDPVVVLGQRRGRPLRASARRAACDPPRRARRPS